MSGSRLLLALCVPLLALAACGAASNPPEGPTAAIIDGLGAGGDNGRRTVGGNNLKIKLPDAPTDEHKALGRLLPREALQLETVKYGGWNGEMSAFFADDPADAPMKAIAADYLSTGYELIESGGKVGAHQTYPQSAHLILVRAPDAVAAKLLARRTAAKLKEQLFAKRDDLNIAFSKSVDTVPIQRYLRIDDKGGKEVVYQAYLLVIGDLLCYALEREERRTLIGPNGLKIAMPGDGQSATRVGGQLLTLVQHAVSSR